MRNIPRNLIEPYTRAFIDIGYPIQKQGLALTWLRYYLDVCGKYHHLSDDKKSLQPFLQKLAEEGQSDADQGQATRSIDLYYQLLE